MASFSSVITAESPSDISDPEEWIDCEMLVPKPPAPPWMLGARFRLPMEMRFPTDSNPTLRLKTLLLLLEL